MKWRRLVSEQARSGQSVKTFCREHGLCRPYFFVWKKRLEEDTPTESWKCKWRGMGQARLAIRALKSDLGMGEA